MKVTDIFRIINNSDRVIIARALPNYKEEIITHGYLALIKTDIAEEIEGAEVKAIRLIPEIYHKRYKELGLMAPMKPEETPDYSFSDLALKLHYKIVI